MVVFTDIKKEDLEKLLKLKSYLSEEVKTIYEQLRMKRIFPQGEVTLILYTSGKLLLQGRSDLVKEVAEQLGKKHFGVEERSKRFRKEKGWFIGSDESLKGDSFGGMVVAAVKADEGLREKLMELGVDDSKKLADKEILLMSEKIKRLVPCEIKSILPHQYNQEIKRVGSVTELLNYLHRQCAEGLQGGKHIVDKYPGCTVGDIMEEKADSKYVEVAAASVLARAAGLDQLEKLSLQAGFRLPKGSSHVKLALYEMREKGLDFDKFTKTSFSNAKEYLSTSK